MFWLMWKVERDIKSIDRKLKRYAEEENRRNTC